MSELYKRIISSLILIPLTIFLIIEGNIFFNLFLILCFFICIYEWYKMVNKIEHKIFGFVYLIFSFFSVFMIRNYDQCCVDFDIGLRLFLITFIICVSSDIGGYIFGKLFKGPTITSISPNKTYSGMIGSYLLSLISVIIFNTFYTYKYEHVFKLFLFVILISTINQVGDIIISYFKRINNVKDTGKIIPGHGGILDRIDGMIFSFPSSYLIYLYIINF